MSESVLVRMSRTSKSSSVCEPTRSGRRLICYPTLWDRWYRP